MNIPIEELTEALRASGNWIAGQRWFGEKTRSILAVEPEMEWLPSTDGVTFALATVWLRFADGGRSRYFVPVAAVTATSELPDHAVLTTLPDGSSIVDALHVSAVHRWLVDRMIAGDVFSGPATTWRWTHFGRDQSTLERARDLPARVLTGEQSNSTLLFGDTLILKVFRRLEPGINPDVEIGEYLTSHFPTVPVPKTFGEGNLTTAGATNTVAAAQEFVPNDGDCWKWLLHVFRDGARAQVEDAARTIALLGTRTGELHMALGAATTDPAFRPEPIDEASCAQWQSALRDEVDLTVHLLRQAGHLDDDSDLARALTQRLGHTTVLRGTEATRVHGDYHLGQVLRTADGDVSILDFEGEPSRPIEDRRRRFSPLKDVAGMTRSLDYARATVQRFPGPPLGDAASLDAWFAHAREAFVHAWREAAAGARGRLAPDGDAEFHQALELFELEKALYETRYELNNRPDWVSIPLAAVLAIAAQGA